MTPRAPAQLLTVRQKQSLFVYLVALLIIEANRLGYELTFGETYRSPEEAARLAKAGKGIAASLHTSRLAIDLNLFKDGRYLTATEAYRPLGEYWAALNGGCKWGGAFTSRSDGNHFELDPKAC